MRYWDINEVMTANEWLDIADDQQWLNDQHSKAESKRRSRK